MSNKPWENNLQWEVIEHPSHDIVHRYYSRLIAALEVLPTEDVTKAIKMIEDAYENRKRIFFIGNGGSHATASHFVADLTKTVFGKNPLPGIQAKPFDVECLSDNVPTLTATANDLPEWYNHIFSLPLLAKWSQDDLLIVITGSWNSGNIIQALETAKQQWVKTIGFLGFDGGKALPMCDHTVLIKSDDYGVIEDTHSSLMHAITDYFKHKLKTESIV